MELTVRSKDGYYFPRLPGDNSICKENYDFVISSNKKVITPELMNKWLLSIPLVEAIVPVKTTKTSTKVTAVLIRLKQDATPKDFGVKYFHDVPNAIIGMLPVS